MSIQYLFDSSFIKTLTEQRNAIQAEIANYSRNIFTLSNSGAHLELFHSDILKELLIWPSQSGNPTNLSLFIDYLNKLNVPAPICAKNYSEAKVYREYKNIDILIADEMSKHCIIIENKINNAGDQKNQLKNYYDYMWAEKYTIDAIVYLTLSGDKSAPKIFEKEINDLIVEMVTFSTSSLDLINGFLNIVQLNATQDFDLQSMVYQYSKLLKYLSQKGMDRSLKQDFYSLVAEKTNFESLLAASNLLQELHIHRAEEFDQRLNNQFEPFRKKYRYKPHYWLYEKFTKDDLDFKLDIQFHIDGSARIDFWIPESSEADNERITNQILHEIGLLNHFIGQGYKNGKSKIFKLSDYKSLHDLDSAFFLFVTEFLSKLKSYES